MGDNVICQTTSLDVIIISSVAQDKQKNDRHYGA